jgi:hypothetical protein
MFERHVNFFVDRGEPRMYVFCSSLFEVVSRCFVLLESMDPLEIG